MHSHPSPFPSAVDKMAAALPALRLDDCLAILHGAASVHAVVLASLATEGCRFDLHFVEPGTAGRAAPHAVPQRALETLIDRFPANEAVFLDPGESEGHWRRVLRVPEASLSITLPLRSGADLIGFVHVAVDPALVGDRALAASSLSRVQPELSQALQRRRAWTLLQKVADTGTASEGDRIFESTARTLVSSLDADLAFVGRVAFDFSVTMRSIAAFGRNGPVAGFSYPLGQLPVDCAQASGQCTGPGCENFMSGRACFLPTRAADLKPSEHWLATRGLDHWLGVPIKNASGSMIGVVAVMFRSPPSHTRRISAVLNVFTERVAAELRRLIAEEEREGLSAVIEATTDLVATVLPSGYITYLNPAGRRLLGLQNQNLSSLSVTNLLGRHPDGKTFARQVLRLADREGSWREDGMLARLDGNGEVPVAQMAVPIRDELGRATSYAVVSRDISRRKAQEAQLLESLDALTRSESLLHGVVNNSTSIIFVKDRGGRYILVNDAYLAYMNMTREAVLGKTDHEIFPPETAESFLASDRRVSSGEQPAQFEESHDFHGEQRTFLTTKFPLLDARNQAYALCGITTDITALKRHVEERLASEHKFRAVFDRANDGILILRGDRFVDCNDRAMQLLGRRREDIVGGIPAMMSPPLQRDGRGSEQSAWERIRMGLGGQEQRFEWLGLRGDGTEIDLDVSVSMVEFNQEPHLLALVRDISERKQAELKEQEQYHFIRQLLDAIPNPVFFKDAEGRYLGCNAAYEAFAGVSRKDLIGKRIHDIEPKEVADLYADTDREFLANPGTRMHEATMTHADGSTRNVLIYRATFLKTDGSVGGLVGVTLDITERKRAERDNLELEAKLRQAQKMESIGHLSGGIAHDFNNILAAILGFTDLARMEASRDPHLDMLLSEIERASLRARDLVAQLLTFSRRSEASNDPILIAPVVSEVVKLLRSTLPKSISITGELPEKLPTVRMSPVHLHQVLMNLGINARDAMEGHGRLDLRVAVADIERLAACNSCHNDFQGSYLMLSVRDDGRGIRAEVLPHIFDPFFTTKEVGSGTGLGLSVLHGIVHSVGGHVQVTSAPGEGTEFRIYLPAVHEPLAECAALAEASRPPALAGRRILIVDDEEQIVACQQQLFAAIGCEVAGFTDPAQALARFREDPGRFDVVITDQTMPGMTGTDLARAVTETRPGMPMLLCTGYLSKATQDAAHSAGIARFLQKPCTAAVLLQSAMELLSGQQPPGRAER